MVMKATKSRCNQVYCSHNCYVRPSAGYCPTRHELLVTFICGSGGLASKSSEISRSVLVMRVTGVEWRSGFGVTVVRFTFSLMAGFLCSETKLLGCHCKLSDAQ